MSNLEPAANESPLLLAIDTSTHVSSIALYDESGLVAETTWHSRENHTRSLMPEIVRLLELVKSAPADLRAVAIATGPGSFTGLRIGLAAAKGLAFSLNIALVGIPTLDISAGQFADQLLPVCAVIQAGRNRFGAAVYEMHSGQARRVGDYFFGSADALVTHLQTLKSFDTKFLVTGEMNTDLQSALHRTLSDTVVLVNEGANPRRAGVLAALAWRRWRSGQRDDIQALVPFYIPTASLA